MPYLKALFPLVYQGLKKPLESNPPLHLSRVNQGYHWYCNERKIFRHAEYESARRDLNFSMGKELELLVFWLCHILKKFESVWSTC